MRDDTLSRLSVGQIAFPEGRNHVKGFTKIHSRTPTLSSTLFCDNFVKGTIVFVILLYKTFWQKLIRK